MSELRQRKGDVKQRMQDVGYPEDEHDIHAMRAELEALRSMRQVEAEVTKDMTEEERKALMANKLVEAFQKGKPQEVKGMSEDVKRWKALLTADPYNMEYIWSLGMAYASDQQWDKCCNVLLKGWKRVQEFKDPEPRYFLLTCLAQASMKCKKYKQALAVVSDVEDPADEALVAKLETLRCQIYCENGDAQKGLKALKKALELRPWDEAVACWANCLGPLRKAGAYELSRESILVLAKTDEQKAKVDTMEKLVVLRDRIHNEDLPEPPSSGRKMVGVSLLALIGFAVLILLYYLESHNLSRLKLK